MNFEVIPLDRLKEGIVKPVFNDLSKEDFKTENHLMQVKSIAECSEGGFCNTFDLH